MDIQFTAIPVRLLENLLDDARTLASLYEYRRGTSEPNERLMRSLDNDIECAEDLLRRCQKKP